MNAVRRAFDHGDGTHNRSLVDTGSSNSSQQFHDENGNSLASTCSDSLSSTAVYDALQTLNKYMAVREKIKSARREIAPQCCLFLQHMRYYVEHCVLRIRATPMQEKMREMHFRKLWHENHQAQQDIAGIPKAK